MQKHSILFNFFAITFLLSITNGDKSFYPRRFGLSPKHEIYSMQELYKTAENELKLKLKIQQQHELKNKLENRRRKIFEQYLGSKVTGTSVLHDFHTNQFL